MVRAALVLAAAAVPTWARAAGEPLQRISVDVRGPLAVVQVDRPLTFGAEALRAPADEVVVDLDLPDGAWLESAEVTAGAAGAGSVKPTNRPSARAGGRLRLEPTDESVADARRAYLAALDAQGGRRARVPVDEGADYRLTVAAPLLGQGSNATSWSLRYRFVAPLLCRQGELVLEMPGSLDPAPAAAEVRVQIHAPGISGLRLARVGPGGQGQAPPGTLAPPPRALSREPVPTAAPWEVAVSLPGGGNSDRPRFHLLSAAGRGAAGDSVVAAALCRPPVPEAHWKPAASRMVLLLDRSRSMGPAGAASARELARGLAMALPPSLAFNAMVFDRTSEPLFPLSRSATLEALAALDDALGMGSLRNGTALAPALRKVAQLQATDAQLRDQPSYLVVITDGALADADRGRALAEAARGLPGGERMQTAVLLLRTEEDERPSAGDRQALAAMAARTGGVLRELGARGLAEAGKGIVADLRAGGDLLDLRVEGARKAATSTDGFEQAAIGPGGGTRLLSRRKAAGPPGSIRVRASYQGKPVTLSSTPAGLDRAAVQALLAERNRPRVARNAEAAVLLAPVNTQDPEAPPVVRGQMDKDVVHKALAYAYLPRARACYLTRAIKTAQDFQLRGRLRLELHLERGEMVGAEVKRSTLGRPEIEACLREAAFAVDIPRALSNDAPVLAVLNLVLRPRTDNPGARPPDGGPAGDGHTLSGTMSQQIDQILGPMPASSDPLELLVEP